MKKVKAILLLFSYLLATNGVAFSLHFCSGKIDSVKFYSAGNKSCCCSKWAKDCCDDDDFFFKLSDSHQNSTPVATGLNAFAFYPVFFPVSSITVDVQPKILNSGYFTDPPPKEGKPLYLLNRTFRI